MNLEKNNYYLFNIAALKGCIYTRRSNRIVGKVKMKLFFSN